MARRGATAAPGARVNAVRRVAPARAPLDALTVQAEPREHALLLPGGVLPADIAYSGLIAELGPGVSAHTKELELYREDRPPAGYGIDDEIDGVLRLADQEGIDRFHMVGYSTGGAISLVFAAKHPERLLSLALMEPAWAGNEGLGPEEQQAWARFDAVAELRREERMPAFVRAHLREGVEPPPPPPGPPPPWMAKRPAGLAALVAAFRKYHLDTEALRSFRQPVYYALGGLSHPDLFQRQAERLGRVFPSFTVEVFDDRHHFDPPHRAEPARLAASLRRVWRAEQSHSRS